MAAEDQIFWTEEWSIENFSCWNYELHGPAITHLLVSTDSFRFRIDLYPKGPDGHGDYILVRIFDDSKTNGELILISSGGSVISKLEVKNPEWTDCSTLLSTELKFKDIVSQMERDPMHKDIITLRYRKSATTEVVFSVCNKIDVIEKFAEIPSKRLKILPWNCSSSLFFLVGDDSKFTKTRVRFFQSDREKLGFEFKLITQLQKCISIKYNFYSLNIDGDLLKSEKIERIFEKEDTWKFSYTLPPKEVESSLFIRLKFVTGRKRENYISHWSYTNLKFENSNFLKVSSKRPEKPTPVLANQLMSAYQDSVFSDFQLRCGGASFPVHKVILAARSPVFKSMLTSDMRETVSGFTDIEDLDPHTLGRFLAFLYTGISEDLELESALKLYYAADKYQVPSLKKECSTVLKNSIAVTNVCDILSLADMHEDDELMSVVTDFIAENYDDILISKEWKCFMVKDSFLLCKTLTALAEKKTASKK